MSVNHVMWSREHENTSYTKVISEEFTFCAENERKLKECRPAKTAHVKAPRFQDRPRANDVDFAGQRLRCAELEQQLNDMKAELEKSNIEIDHELSNDFTRIIGSAKHVTPFINVFCLLAGTKNAVLKKQYRCRLPSHGHPYLSLFDS